MQKIIMNFLSHYENLPTQYCYPCTLLMISIFLNYTNEISKYIKVKQMNKLCSLKIPFLVEKRLGKLF